MNICNVIKNADNEPERRDGTTTVNESEGEVSSKAKNLDGIAAACAVNEPDETKDATTTDGRREMSKCARLPKENLVNRPQEKKCLGPGKRQRPVLRDLEEGGGELKPIAWNQEITLEKLFDGLRSKPYRRHANMDEDQRKAYNATLRKRYHRLRKLYARMTARNLQYASSDSSNCVIMKPESERYQRLSPQELEARRRRRQELANVLRQKAAAQMVSVASVECIATRRKNSISLRC